MPTERKDTTDTDFTDAELDMLADFTDAVQAGGKPDIEEYLKRCPGSEAKMRPILATALRLDREITQFRREHPDIDLARLLDLKHRPQPGKK
jgi:hypothetical protein